MSACAGRLVITRLIDSTGAAWPVCAQDCSTCGLPSTDGGEHPMCAPATAVEPWQHDAAIHLLAAELGATIHRPLNTWLISQRRTA
jgi:hypothetical protein